MDLLEYQGKALFAEAGLPVLRSQLITDADEAEPAARELGFPVAVKA
jgi:succinyl-CoA synthetase beta subunit